MGVWQSVRQQVGGLAKHVASSIASEPMEVIKDAVGASGNGSENQAMQAMEQGTQTQQNTGTANDPHQPKGFKTVQDFQKYQQLSGNKDEMEIAMLRKRLFSEYGLDTNLESGMKRARMEYEQKEQQRKQAEEQKEEQKKMEDLQVKKQEENIALKAAQQGSSAENKAWGAG